MKQLNLQAISGDPTQIHQALMNLCVNARDTLAAGDTLTIEAENKFLDQRWQGDKIPLVPACACPQATLPQRLLNQ